MRRYPEHLVRQARRLCSVGDLSQLEISNRLRVGNSQVSLWCRGLSGGPHKELIRKNEERRQQIRVSETGFLKGIVIGQTEAKLYCAILYGCEGSKYPASNGVFFTNSDPCLVRSFLVIFRKAFMIEEDRLRIHLQIHTDQDFRSLVRYWSKLLSIPPKQFYRPTVTSPTGKKHRNEYLGTCSLRYGDYRIQLKLIGIFDQFLRKSAELESGQDGNARGR